MLDPTRDVRPRIVGDFKFGGIEYIVVYWPEQEFVADGEVIDEAPEQFQCYRKDILWGWLAEAVDVRQ